MSDSLKAVCQCARARFGRDVGQMIGEMVLEGETAQILKRDYEFGIGLAYHYYSWGARELHNQMKKQRTV